MQMPLELAFKDVERTRALEEVIDDQVAALENVSDRITSCRVVIERPNEHPDNGSGYSVCVLVRVPPHKEIVVKRESTEGEIHDALPTVVKDAFQATVRQCRELMRRQRGDVKAHPDQEVMAVVQQLFRDEDYGFLETIDARQVYFHRNSVVNDDFDRLDIGTGVRYLEERGNEGPQATTVAIVEKPSL